jgi:hypothetical protein
MAAATSTHSPTLRPALARRLFPVETLDVEWRTPRKKKSRLTPFVTPARPNVDVGSDNHFSTAHALWCSHASSVSPTLQLQVPSPARGVVLPPVPAVEHRTTLPDVCGPLSDDMTEELRDYLSNTPSLRALVYHETIEHAQVFCNWAGPEDGMPLLLRARLNAQDADDPQSVVPYIVGIRIPDILSLTIRIDAAHEKVWCCPSGIVTMTTSVEECTTFRGMPNIVVDDWSKLDAPSNQLCPQLDNIDRVSLLVECLCRLVISNVAKCIFSGAALEQFSKRRAAMVLVVLMDTLYTRLCLPSPKGWEKQVAEAARWCSPSAEMFQREFDETDALFCLSNAPVVDISGDGHVVVDLTQDPLSSDKECFMVDYSLPFPTSIDIDDMLPVSLS